MQDSKLLVKLIHYQKLLMTFIGTFYKLFDKTNGIIHNEKLITKLDSTLCKMLMMKLFTTRFAGKLIVTSFFIQ